MMTTIMVHFDYSKYKECRLFYLVLESFFKLNAMELKLKFLSQQVAEEINSTICVELICVDRKLVAALPPVIKSREVSFKNKLMAKHLINLRKITFDNGSVALTANGDYQKRGCGV